ncbi:MAG: N-6 DNA methylase [Bacteroidales bacterium]|nr:N-6 DNA methylase [Bacteroidales bacterium]
MAQPYSKQQLREIFQTQFNQESWKAILHNLFRAELIRKQAEKFTADDDNEDGFYLGALKTSDSFRIGLFYFVIKSGSVAHKKVGLRNLVKQFVNPTWGEFDAAIVVFDDKREWRLSFVCDIKDVKTTPKRYTFVFGEHDNFYRTAIERFLTIQNSEPSFENIRKAFSVDALSDDFFDTYRGYYADFVQYITGKRYVKEGSKWVERELGKPNFQYTTTFNCDDKLVRDYVKKMFGRIVFLYFLQRKGWLNGDRQYMHNLFYNSTAKDNFLDGVLEPLFFEVLNTDKQYRTADANALPGSENIPYLNGGLFARDEIDELDCVFPEDYFKKLFDFLDSYNFTIDENDVDDAEIGIDPEMLGRIFENLLEDNKDKGAFYTPKEIVNYMCRESLIAYLQNGVPECSHELIRNFVENSDASHLNADQSKYLRKKLQAVKICDPAIGSGAFPMGLVNILSRLYIAMKADTDTSKMKRHIIENNIYGVDIENGAVDIARLRFWLAMIVEEKEPMPLPNLHFKIMQGNSLLESINGIDLSDLTKTNAARSLFDSTDSERENLKTALSQYYNTSNHTDRDRLFNEIINNVRRQIYAKNPNIDQTGLDPSANDKFFLWHTWFADVFDNGGFDIVIGNPPYIKEYTNRSAFEGFRDISKYYQGKMDLWYGFACNGIDMLNNNGILCFIATNNWVASSGSSKLREKIRRDTILKTFIDFGSYLIFEDSASIQTMIMLVERSCIGNEFKTHYAKNLLPNSKFPDIIKLLDGNATKDSYGEALFKRNQVKDFFTFGSANSTQICEKLTENAIYLDDKSIAQGIIGAPDEAFIVSDLEKFNETEKQYIKPYYTGLGDKYKLYKTDKYIIYLSAQNFSEEQFYSSFNFINHFEPYKESLIKSKIRFKTPNKPYYYLHRERKEIFFKKGSPRIISQGRALVPTFVYTEEDCYISRALFAIKTNNINLKYLCGLLNSKVIQFWLFNKGKRQGNSYQIDKGPLMSIPIKIDKSKEMLICQTIDTIIDSNSNTLEIKKLITKIDLIFFHIYGLTYDEVLIVDPETPITREKYDSYE